jgi:uncharacterized protein YkwD
MRLSHRNPARPGTRIAAGTRGRRNRFALPVVAAAFVASLTLSASTAHAADCAGANVLPALSSIPAAQASTLCLLNNERASRGLAPLTDEATLESVATGYSQAMVQQRFFGHVSPSGGTLTDRLASYVGSATSYATGENLAWGEGTLGTPAAIVRGWMASPGHRDNILNDAYREIGIGIVTGSPVGSLPAASATYTTEFGARESAAPGSAPTRASASSAEPLAVTAPRGKSVSASTKRQISTRCHRVARRTKGSKKTRAARYDRCVSQALRAAAR